MTPTIPLFKVFMPASVMEPLRETLFSGFVGQGPKVAQFEECLRGFLHHRHVVTLNSCTSALHLTYRLIGLEPGDEVISSPLTCTATNWPILAHGASIAWADVDPATANLDPATIPALITPRTKAIVVVHWSGYPCDLDAIGRIAEAHGLPVVEDAAHAFGAEYQGRKIGSHSDFVCFSFQAIKHMTTIDGGLLLTRDEAAYRRGKLLRWYGIDRETRADFRCEDDVADWGYKFHMNDVAATIGLEQLKHVAETLRRHRANAAYYRAALAGVPGITLMEEKTDRLSAYWIFTLKAERRDDFQRRMTELGIATSRVHERNDQHSCVRAFRRPLPQLDELVRSMICIPVGWWVTREDREFIVDGIRRGW